MGSSLSAGGVAAAVGEQKSGATEAEDATGNAHAALVAQIHTLAYVLRAHHQRLATWVHLPSDASNLFCRCTAAVTIIL